MISVQYVTKQIESLVQSHEPNVNNECYVIYKTKVKSNVFMKFLKINYAFTQI